MTQSDAQKQLRQIVSELDDGKALTMLWSLWVEHSDITFYPYVNEILFPRFFNQLICVDEDRIKLQPKITKLRTEIDKLKIGLTTSDFLSKAPQEAVDKKSSKLKDLQDEFYKIMEPVYEPVNILFG